MGVKSDRIISPDRDFEIVTPDGVKLDATAYHPSYREIRGGVVVAHGFGRRLDQRYPLEVSDKPDDAERALAIELGRRGLYSEIYSQRGHNGSGGVLSFGRSIDDLEHVSRATRERVSTITGNGYGDNLFAVGFSMGGYAALHAAARNPGLYKAVVAISAPHSMKQVLPNYVHSAIRQIIGHRSLEPLGRYVIAALKIWKFNGGSMVGFLRELAKNPEERARLFTHIGESRLPDRLQDLYLDLVRSPDIDRIAEPIQTPVLLLHPEHETLLHGKRGKEEYLDVFRRNITDFTEEMFPGTHHVADSSQLAKYADRIAEFLYEHMSGTEPASSEPQARSA